MPRRRLMKVRCEVCGEKRKLCLNQPFVTENRTSLLGLPLMEESVNALSQEVHDNDRNEQVVGNIECSHAISCTTFNILAPIYKRLGGGLRESDFWESWHTRNESILNRLLHLKSSVICLQEFWVGNEELVAMYEKRLSDAGYVTYKLAWTNNRGDGLLTAVHRSQLRVLKYRELLLKDMGDRVAQLLHVELCCSTLQNKNTNSVKEALIVNTHLIFPHDSTYCFIRLQQVYKILQYIRSYMEKYSLSIPVILCGDWNGSKKGHVYKFLCSQGFVSSYDTVHSCEDDNDDSQKWISHRNHRGNFCGVDFIWLQNPQKYPKPLKESFMEAILGNIKNLLHKVITGSGGQVPDILRIKGSCITFADFSQALVELGIIGHPDGSLGDEDIKEIWERLDTDGDGIADVPNFLKAWTLCSSLQRVESYDKIVEVEEPRNSETITGFVVKKATLFPEEAEEGTWPENYMLSDHAHLTVEFAVKEGHCV